ncbi:MAG: Conjugal transfer protein TrbL [Acidimicrobiia bacterium]|nr:Conjugal transfer protein TrbL [Acidimicrobiia bacterium]
MLIAAGGLNSGIYKFLVVLHLIVAIVGFGGVLLNGVYAAQARKRPGPEGRAVIEANYAVSMLAEKFIYAVPVLGLAAMGLSDKAWKFSQTWIWLSLLLYVVGIGISHSVMMPGHRQSIELLRQMEAAPVGGGRGGPPAQVAELQANGTRLALGGMVLNLVLVTIIALMVWKPGV